MSDKEIRKTSLLRFRAYEKAWKVYKLGEISDRITRKNTNLESTLPLTISAQYGLIDQKDFFNKQVASRDISGYFLMENGEFAYNKSYSKDYPWGTVKRLEKYARGVLSTLYIVFKPKNVNPSYLSAYYDSFKWHKEVSMRATEGARNHGLLNISPQDFFETQVAVPMSENEQERIGEFFEQINEIIRLYQRELELLQLGKQMLISKMFPKDGEIVPEIRFKGFANKWERRKLGDIASEMVAGGDIDKNLVLEEGRYPVIANALSGDGIVGYYDTEYRITAPAVTVTGRGDVGHAKARLVDFTPVVRLLSVKSTHDVFFLENAINTLRIVIESTGVPQLTVPQLAKYELFFPQHLAEEEKIGAFFKELDHLITLHQRKFEAIKKMKKTLLKYMFI